MNDPYSVLGIDRSASDDKVKEAYRKLAVKYSTNEYAESPLADMAAQKLAEIDDAYDRIMSERRLGGDTRSSGSQQSYTPPQEDYAYSQNGVYRDIREYIRRGDYATAESKLLDLDEGMRGAEWNYLMGQVCRGKGWLDDAMRYYSNAASMEPSNAEYASAYNQFSRQRATGQGNYSPFGSGSSGGCCGDDDCSNLCSCLCCMSLCNSCCRN